MHREYRIEKHTDIFQTRNNIKMRSKNSNYFGNQQRLQRTQNPCRLVLTTIHQSRSRQHIFDISLFLNSHILYCVVSFIWCLTSLVSAPKFMCFVFARLFSLCPYCMYFLRSHSCIALLKFTFLRMK